MKIIGKFFSFFVLVLIISAMIFVFLNVEFGKHVQVAAETDTKPTFIIDAGHGERNNTIFMNGNLS